MSRLLVYAQLVRLPNAFTAMADIALGALVTGALPDHAPTFLVLLLGSTFLYWAGMVWNDYFDLEQDRHERPFRPLPSGRVPVRHAFLLGVVLLAGGLACAVIADWTPDGLRWQSLPLALGLALAILLYDAWLKRTWAGPLGMGACRFLNVLLGLSVTGSSPEGWGLMLALVVGVYIVGVTWFARTEARESNRTALTGAAGVMLAALLLALTIPILAQEKQPPPRTSILFPYLLVVFGFFVGLRVWKAIGRPIPRLVQGAVKRAVLGLIVLDAILATALAGMIGLLLVILLLPAMTLGRWLYST